MACRRGCDRTQLDAPQAAQRRVATQAVRSEPKANGDRTNLQLVISYDMRAPSFGAPAREHYAAALDQAAWADAAST